MLKIHKKAKLHNLDQYKRTSDSTYNNMPTEIKNILRDALLEEQFYLCAYCMSRIDKTKMRIEHFYPQSEYIEEALNYDNMLACCCGNEGKENTTCDVHKKDKEISIQLSPSNNNRIEEIIKYLSSGKIYTDNENFNKEIDEILNLNFDILKNNRKIVHERVIKELSKCSQSATKSEIQKILDNWETPNNGKLPEYTGVAKFFLKRRLKISK